MGWIDLRVLAGGIDSVVAGGAVVSDSGVVEHCGREGATGNVAGATVFECCDVIGFCIHTGGINTVVAGIATAAGNFGTGVVHKRVSEAGRIVADRTIAAGVLVNGCWCFSSGSQTDVVRAAVMTGSTVPGDAQMVETGRRESGNGMAQVTILVCWQMICCFDGGCRDKLTDMTALAAAIEIRVYRREEVR